MTKRIIRIADEFSKYPGGRYRTDGSFSGEQFRDDVLRPVLDASEQAIIELDGTRGYGSSFLEEAFGGLVRIGYLPIRIKQAFEFRSSDTSLIDEIVDYIDHGAEPEV